MNKRVLTPGTFAFVPSALAADPDLDGRACASAA